MSEEAVKIVLIGGHGHGKTAALLAMSAALGGQFAGPVHVSKAWKAPEEATRTSATVLAAAEAKREARRARVVDRLRKGSPEHKFKPKGWNGQRYVKSYES